MSVVRATLDGMEVAEHDVARIPVRNLRVPRDDFVAVWRAARRRGWEQGERGVTDWYSGGVAATCTSWIAGAMVQAPNGRRIPARSPATNRSATAYEELIEAEYLAAELLDVRRPDLLVHRPGWCEAARRGLARPTAPRRGAPRPPERGVVLDGEAPESRAHRRRPNGSCRAAIGQGSVPVAAGG